MRLFRFAAVDWFVSFGLRQQLYLCGVPQFFRHDAFVQAVHQQIILLWNLMILVPGAVNLFKLAATKGNFSTVDRIFQNGPNQCRTEKGRGAVLTGEFLKTVGLQIFGKTICACVRIYILLKNRANGRGFVLVDLQHTVNQTIAIRRKTAVPAAFSCFLDATFHGLDTDVLTLDLSDSRQNGNHQLASVFRRINAVLHANQVHTKILHYLQGRQYIGSVAAKTGELEHQHIGNTILAGFDVLHHPAERSTAFNGFARFACILIFADDLVIIEVSVGFHASLLCIQ